MPITTTISVSFRVTRLDVDMTGGTATAFLARYENDAFVSEVRVVASGQDFLTLLGQQPGAGLSRAEDVTQAVYQFAVDSGQVVGQIS